MNATTQDKNGVSITVKNFNSSRERRSSPTDNVAHCVAEQRLVLSQTLTSVEK